MKKKIYGILTTLFLLFACVFVSACGNRYEKAEYKISYAFTETAGDDEWFDASQGVSINYGASNDKLIMDENGYGKIYFKVEILNVKAKYIGQIAVSTNLVGGMESLSKNLVEQNEIFAVTISSSVQTQISFSEGNSELTKSIDFNVYKSLVSISANEEKLPAVVVGQTIDLSTIGNIVYTPHDTNQKGVTYAVESIGAYNIAGEDRPYTHYLGTSVENLVYIEEGTNNLVVSEIAKDYLSSAYVVRIKATSLFSTEEDVKETTFDLYLVEKLETDVMPVLTYENGNEVTDVYLYGENNDYSSVVINVANDINSIYGKGPVATLNGEAEYVLNVYVLSASGGNIKKYNFDEVSAHTDMKIEKITPTQYRLVYVKSSNLVNRIRFSYEIQGLSFVGTAPVSSTEITLTKMVLPTSIKINGQSGDRLSYDVYSNLTSRGIALKIEASPTNAYTSTSLKEKIEFNAALTGLQIKDSTGKTLSDSKVTILSGDTIYVKFSGFDRDNATLTFETKRVPTEFKGEKVNVAEDTITNSVTLNKVVTADNLALYADIACKVSDVYVNAEETTYVYVKAGFTQGSDINDSTIKLVSDNPNLTFGETLKTSTIYMNNKDVVAQYPVPKGTKWYKVPVNISGQTDITEYTFKMIAGNNNVVATATVTAVYLSDGTKYDVSSANATEIQSNVFAIEKDKLSEFTVLDGGRSNTIAGLAPVIAGMEKATDEGVLAKDDVTVVSITYMPNNVLSIKGIREGHTQIVSVDVARFELKKTAGVDESYIVTATTNITLQIAVYDPIGTITATASSRDIYYVNNKVTGIGVNIVEIDINSISANRGTCAGKIAIKDGDNWVSVDNPAGQQVSELKFYYTSSNNVQNGNLSLTYDGVDLRNQTEFTYLKGKIVVTLNKEIENLEEFKITVVAKQFGKERDVKNYITLSVLQVQRVDEVEVSAVVKDDLIYNNSPVPQLELSYQGQRVGDSVGKQLTAVAKYYEIDSMKARCADIGYVLYEYKLDENGQIETDEYGHEIYNEITNSNRLSVAVAKNIVTVSSIVGSEGGRYLLRLVALDSFNGTAYDEYSDVIVRISDGSKKNKYLIKDEADFFAINNGLNSYYALVADLDLDGYMAQTGATLPIGWAVRNGDIDIQPFTGGLTTDGAENVVPHTIKYTVSQYIASTAGNGYNAGLFTYIGSDAEIANINLNAKFNVSNSKDDPYYVGEGQSYLGALAGTNDSLLVKNVRVAINDANVIELYKNEAVFGALVGKNNGAITACSVEYDNVLQFNAINKNISVGMFVGQNYGSIIGNYLGNESLNSINFDVLGYIEVLHEITVVSELYQVGGVSGRNQGTIQNMLVGGSVSIVDSYVSTEAKQYVQGCLGGIAGVSTGKILTSATLAMDLTATTETSDGNFTETISAVYVGGLVGRLSDTDTAELYNSKYISVRLKNSSFVTYGTIVANNDKYASLVADWQTGTISYCGAQSFVKGIQTLKEFVANNSTDNAAEYSYIIVDGYMHFVGDGSYTVYYDEDVMTGFTLEDYFEPKTDVTAENYASIVDALWIKDGKNYKKAPEEFVDGTTYYEFTWNAYDASKISDSASGWAEQSDINFVSFAKYEKANFNFPYLLDTNNKALIILQPNRIEAALNQDYIIEIDSIYVNEDNYDNAYKVDEALEKFIEGVDYYFVEAIKEHVDTSNFSSKKASGLWIESYGDYLKIKDEDFDPNAIYYTLTVIERAVTEYNFVENSIRGLWVYSDDSDGNYLKTNGIYTETVIVNYLSAPGVSTTEENTHKIKDLINIETFPKEAQAGLSYEILGAGWMYAYLGSDFDNDKTITFIGASGQTSIILKVYSLFNPEVVKYFEIHTMLGLTNITAESGFASKIDDDEYELRVYTGGNQTVLTIGAENIVARNGKVLDCATILNVEDIEKYIRISCTDLAADSVLEIKKNDNDIMEFIVNVKPGQVVEKGHYETVKFTLELNLAGLLKGNFEETAQTWIELDTIDVVVKVFHAAEDLSVSTDNYEIVTKENITVNARLITGFVDNQSTLETESVTKTDYNRIKVGGDTKDSITFTFDCVEGTEELTRLLSAAKEKDVVDLFDFTATSEPIFSEDFKVYVIDNETKFNEQKGALWYYDGEYIRVTNESYVDGTTYYRPTTLGYNYQTLINLKENFDYRYINNTIILKATISASSDSSVKQEITIKLMPTEVSTVRIENYAVNNIKTDVEDKVNIIERNLTETAIITPGGKGSMMYIFIEPSYSNIKKAVLSTSELNIPSIANPVGLRFTQFVYNDKDKRYQTLKTGLNQIGNELELSIISGYDVNGQPYYTGIIYIHAQLAKFSGVEETITATLKVTTENGKVITTTKPLLTDYLPGASISHNGEKLNGESVVEKGSYTNSATITVSGYNFNSNPLIEPGWNLDGVKVDNKAGYEYTSLVSIDTLEPGEKVTSHIEGRIENAEHFDKYLADNNVSFLWYKKAHDNGTTNTDDDYYVWSYTKEFITSGVYDGKYYKVTNYTELNSLSGTLYIGNYISYNLLNNYTEVTENADRSHSMELTYNVASDIPVPFHISASISMVSKDGKFVTSDKAYLQIRPVDYLLKQVQVSRLAGNSRVMLVGNTEQLDLRFVTLNSNADYSEEIYAKMLKKYSDKTLAARFSYHYGEDISFDQELSAHPEFDVNIINDKVALTAIAEFDQEINFKADYGYEVTEDGQYSLNFNKTGNTISTSFRLSIYPLGNEDKAIPINSASDLYAMQAGQHYILTTDITLENHVPINTAIGSLDGNNRIITIQSFASNVEVSNYGLFGSIGTYTAVADDVSGVTFTEQTLLKNVMVNYGECENIVLTDITSNDIVFGGLVAINNGGLIYNCDVINSKTVVQKTVSLIVDNKAEKTLTFGGLVGINNKADSSKFDGVITNSRVGRKNYTLINASKTYETTYEKLLGSLKFVISSGAEEGNSYSVVAGEFVGENNGTIASSYVANMTLVNYSSSQTENKTAGFVATNKGTISYSYVKGLESTITSTMPYSTGAGVTHMGNGTIAGFAYENIGNINNSFANLELVTNSAYIAGFVYDNKAGATVSESYAAASMNAQNEVDDFAEQPFVGVSKAGEVLSNGTLQNAYYLIKEGQDGAVVDYEKDMPTAFNEENFQESNNLIGFVFINSNSLQERQEGLWSYTTVNGERHILPELTNANNIAHSYRFIANEEEAGNNIYTNAASYAPGTKNNPYIIRNVNEYNSILRPSVDVKSRSGYFRLINNIDFESETGAVTIKTRTKFTLGDAVTKSNVTSLDGNGMSINGVYLDVAEESQENNSSIGLFAEIHNAYVKNVKLKFATPKSGDQYSSTNIQYSGGLAGRIIDSAIINVTLDGASATLTGQNFVGGLSGYIGGTSMIYSVTSNLSVKAGVSNAGEYLYYTQEEYTALGKGAESYETYLSKLSYAGGLAGVLDLKPRKNTQFNVSFVNIYGEQMKQTTKQGDANILADYVGGIAGFANINTKALKLKYYTGKKDIIRGRISAGGLFGVLAGSVTASQVAAIELPQTEKDENNQYFYDTTLGAYILGMDRDGNPNEVLNVDKIGNTKLIESYKYAGGIAGIAVDAIIDSSYAKASFMSGEEIGGLAGVSVGTSVKYSYAVPYVNYYNGIKYAGGLFGSTYKVENGKYSQDPSIRELENFAKLTSTNTRATDVQFTFSTLLINKKDFTSTSGMKLDYIAANVTADSLKNSGTNALTYTFAGKVKDVDYNKIVTLNSDLYSRTSSIEIYKLYNHETSDYVTTYAEVFSAWSTSKYWTLDNTKYFPLLLSNAVDNFIPIVTPDDFAMLLANPEGKYKLVSEVYDMSNWQKDENLNWIFNCTFQGVLLGDTGKAGQQNKKPVVKNLRLTPKDSGTTGLFRETKNASISNITFVWQDDDNVAINPQAGVTITSIGGVSCLDNKSTITNVDVQVGSNVDWTKEESTLYSGSASLFGGIVADATDTNIMACTFTGKVNLTLNATQDKNAFGGIVGYGVKTLKTATETKAKATVEEEEVTSLTIVNCYVGTSERGTDFEITTQGDKEAFIGNIAGYVKNAAISSNKVADVNYRAYSDAISTSNVILRNDAGNGARYYGGLIGYALDTSIVKNDVSINLQAGGKVNGGLYFAGLVGSLKANGGDQNIEECNANIYFDIAGIEDDASSNPIVIAGGVAKLEGTTKIKQCLFVGDVINEVIDPAKKIMIAKNVVAGGVVAQNSATLTIQETMSYVDLNVGSSNTTQLIAGGLVASNSGNLTIIACATAGKIVPTTNNTIDTDKVIIGGFVGSNTNTLQIKNSYSTTSIITDGLLGNSIKQAKVNGAVGSGSAESEFNEVYFSSDIALTSDSMATSNPQGEVDTGLYNLTANSLLYSKDWRNNFYSYTDGSGPVTVWLELEGFNSVITGAQTRLPYIYSLRNSLEKYHVLEESGKVIDYVQGSSLNPITLLESGVTFKDEFTYYLYSPTAEKTFKLADGATTSLNGVLIGDDYTFELVDLNGNSLLPKVNKHSAISNFHICLENDLDSGDYGLIVDENYGMIYNCSVISTKTINSEAESLGLIAHNNIGLISNSYSTAEIVVTNDSGSVSGIVYTNSARISTCYYTGYIDGNGAGIIYTTYYDGSEDSAYDNTYVYNCYSAGVVTSVQNKPKESGINSFINQGFNDLEKELRGADNSIDQYANNESGVTINGTVVTATSTYGIMSNQTGMHSVITSTIVNANATTFGYNYEYPVIKLNKYGRSASGFNLIDNKFQLYTGNGGADYKDTYKIPHLGVLTSIQGILAYEERDTQRALNYVLIYDINAQETKWTAIGSKSDAEIYGFSGVVNGFTGVFYSNRGYAYSIENNLCTITNMNKNGLFDRIHNATISDLTLGNFIGLVNSGALGTSVVKAKETDAGTPAVIDEGTKTSVTINNIHFIPDSVISGATGATQANSVGALFGTIEDANVTITEFDTGYVVSESQILTIHTVNSGDNSSSAGLVAGKITSGNVIVTACEDKISIDGEKYIDADILAVQLGTGETGAVNIAGAIAGTSSGNITINSEVYVDLKCSNAKNAGTLLGAMSGGYIAGTGGISVTLNAMNMGSGTNPIEIMGGFVGAMSDGKVSYFNLEVGGQILAQSFGGFVGSTTKVTSNSITNCKIEANDNKLEIISNLGEQTQFGLLTAWNEGTIDVDASDVSAINTICIAQSSNVPTDATGRTGGVGTLVGYNSGNVILGGIKGLTTVVTEEKPGDAGDLPEHEVEAIDEGGETITNLVIEINSPKITNLGGLVGYYAGGTLEGGASYHKTVELYGTNNVGGLFGTCAVAPSSDWTSLNDKAIINIDFNRDAFNSEIAEESYANFGGLFGLLTCRVEENLTNSNDIVYGEATRPFTVRNVGGIAGRYQVEYNEITYGEGEEKTVDPWWNVLGEKVKTKTDGNIVKLDTNEEGKLVCEYYGYQNAGTISGTLFVGIDNPIFANGTADGDVINTYNVLSTNVGGIFGNVELSIKSGATLPEGSSGIILKNMINTQPVQGYNNVGGLIGYIEGATDSSQIIITQHAVVGGTGSVGVTGPVSYSEDPITNATAVTNVTFEKIGTESLKVLTKDAIIAGVSNVGGIVGSIDSEFVTITNIYLGKIEEGDSAINIYGNTNVGALTGSINSGTINNTVAQKVNVTAVYYREVDMVTENEAKKVKEKVYIPTSVGGLTGKTVDATLTNNVIYLVNVLSVEEGSDSTTESKGIISTISNYMNPGEKKEPTNFRDVKTGFGGFVGTIDLDTIKKTLKEGSPGGETTNYLVAISVKAQLGINVGAYYGVITGADAVYTVDGQNYYLAAPYLYGSINVDGAYNIGGIVGRTDKVSNYKNSYLHGGATINLQPNLVGMYVGGLVGNTESNVDDSVIDYSTSSKKVNILIDTSRSYFVGGLVGRVKGTISTVSVGTPIGGLGDAQTGVVAGSDKITKQAGDDYLTHILNAENFGGIVGLVKSGGTSPVSVQGYSKYPFTVNTIENDNYTDVASEFTVDDTNSSLYLIAQAFYKNNTIINVSASKNTTLYDDKEDHNPLFPAAIGWAKKYTGFRRIRRCIPQSGTWDSLEMVYDAYNIRHVELSTQTNGGGNGEHQVAIGDILFTVYEETEGQPKIYAPIGIGTIALNYDEDNGDKACLQVQDQTPSAGDWILGALITNETPPSVYFLDLGLNDLHYFDWKKAYTTVGGANKTFIQNDVNGTNSVVHFVEGYYEGDIYKTIDGKSSKGAYFIFDVVYENKTLGDAYNSETLPASGSVFDIKGQFGANARNAQINPGKKDWFGIISAIVGFVIDAAITYFSGGGWAALKTVFKTGLKQGKKILLKLIGKAIKKGIKGAIYAYVVSQIVSNFLPAEQSSQQFYLDRIGEYGLLASAYNQEIRLINGQVQYSYDSYYVDDNGNMYTYVSKERPAHYYSNYYAAMDLENIIIEYNKKFDPDISTSQFQYGYAGFAKDWYNTYNLQELLPEVGISFETKSYDYFGNTIKTYKDDDDDFVIYLGQAEGHTFVVVPNYAYHNDSYWQNINSLKANTYETSIAINKKLDSPKYYETDGKVYYIGMLDTNRKYQLNTDGEVADNNLKYESSTYKHNGIDIDKSKVTRTINVGYKEAASDELKQGWVEGVHYLNGVYYARSKTSLVADEKTRSAQYATFTKVTDGNKISEYNKANSEYKENIDYVKYTFTATGQPAQTVYYAISDGIGSATEEMTVDTILGKTITTENGQNKITYAPKESITLQVYPYSAENPYEGTKNDMYFDYTKEGDDEYIYVWTDTTSEITFNNPTIYFLYDAGYMVKDKKVFVEVEKKGTSGYDDATQRIAIYNSAGKRLNNDGNAYSESDTTKPYQGVALSTLIKWWGTLDLKILQNYYIDNYAGIKVLDVYQVKDNKIYELDESYTISEEGNLLVTYYSSDKAKPESYIYNKFCSDKDHNLYTRYKYTFATKKDDNNMTSFSDKWLRATGRVEDKQYQYIVESTEYYLLKDGYSGRPNGRPTCLVERVQIQIACGGITVT